MQQLCINPIPFFLHIQVCILDTLVQLGINVVSWSLQEQATFMVLFVHKGWLYLVECGLHCICSSLVEFFSIHMFFTQAFIFTREECGSRTMHFLSMQLQQITKVCDIKKKKNMGKQGQDMMYMITPGLLICMSCVCLFIQAYISKMVEHGSKEETFQSIQSQGVKVL